MNKRERLKSCLIGSSRKGLRILSLAALAGSAYATTAGTVFNVSGAFDGGVYFLTGTITIDTVGGGGILGEALTVDPAVATYNFTGSNDGTGLESFSSGPTEYYDNAEYTGSPSSSLNLDIFLGTSSGFVGYTGGNLCSDQQSCGGAETSFTNVADPMLNSGTVSAASPEPSTVALMLGGGVAAALRRRKRSCRFR